MESFPNEKGKQNKILTKTIKMSQSRLVLWCHLLFHVINKMKPQNLGIAKNRQVDMTTD